MAAYKKKTASADDSGISCVYCGDDLQRDTLCSIDGKNYHRRCIECELPRCQRAIADYNERFTINKNNLYLGIHVSYLYGLTKEDISYKKSKKKKREYKVQELLSKVSALRNSNSGRLFIHLVGLKPGDQFIGAFNEFADFKLYELIQDGSDFADVYKKHHLGTCPELAEYSDIIVLYVEGSPCVTTSNFKTKIALDDCLIDPHATNVRGFLKKKTEFKGSFHKVDVSDTNGLKTLQESRSVQLKSAFLSKESDDNVVTSLLTLKLTEYISAFTKHEEGGSYFFGLNEEQVVLEGEYTPYKSKTVRVQPVLVKDRKTVEKEIKQKVNETVLVCDYEGNEAQDKDILQVKFVSVPNVKPSEDRCVIHVSAKPVNGIVFYDKHGPVAYRTADAEITKINLTDWFRIFREENRN